MEMVNTTPATQSQPIEKTQARQALEHKIYNQSHKSGSFYGLLVTKNTDQETNEFKRVQVLSWAGSCLQEVRYGPGKLKPEDIQNSSLLLYMNSANCLFKTSTELFKWVDDMNDAGMVVEFNRIYNNVKEFNLRMPRKVLNAIAATDRSTLRPFQHSENSFVYEFEIPLAAYKNIQYGPYITMCYLRYAFYNQIGTNYSAALDIIRNNYPEMDKFEQYQWAEYLDVRNIGSTINPFWHGDYKSFSAKFALSPMTREEYEKQARFIYQGSHFGKIGDTFLTNKNNVQTMLREAYVEKLGIKDMDKVTQKDNILAVKYLPNAIHNRIHSECWTKEILDEFLTALKSGELELAKELLSKIQKTSYQTIQIKHSDDPEYYSKIVVNFDDLMPLRNAITFTYNSRKQFETAIKMGQLYLYFDAACYCSAYKPPSDPWRPDNTTYEYSLKEKYTTGLTQFELDNECVYSDYYNTYINGSGVQKIEPQYFNVLFDAKDTSGDNPFHRYMREKYTKEQEALKTQPTKTKARTRKPKLVKND